MEYKLPCITTFEGGIPSIINHKENGLIIPQNNPQELAKAMQFMIENPKIAKEMGVAACRKFQNEYTLKIFEERFISILNDILKNE